MQRYLTKDAAKSKTLCHPGLQVENSSLLEFRVASSGINITQYFSFKHRLHIFVAVTLQDYFSDKLKINIFTSELPYKIA